MIWLLPQSLLGAVQDQTTSQEVQSQPIQEAETETIKGIALRLDEIQKILPDVYVQAEETITRLSPRLNQLFRLKSFVGNKFREISLIRHALVNLNNEFQKDIKPIQTLDKELEAIRSVLVTSKSSLLEQLKLPDAWTPEKSHRFNKLKALLHKLQEHQTEISQIQDKSSAFSKQLDSFEQQIKEEMSRAGVEYFFVPAPTIFQSDLKQWLDDYRHWQQSLPVYLNFFLLGRIQWIPFASYLLLFTAGSLLALVGGIRFLQKKLPGIAGAFCFSSLIMISVSIAIWPAMILHQSDYQSLILINLAQLLIMRALVQFFRRTQRLSLGEGVVLSNHLIVLWYAFASALVLQTLDFPKLPMQGLWTILLILFTLWINKHKSTSTQILERVYRLISLFVLPGLALLSILGWIHLSLLLTAFWFVLALALQFGNLATQLLRQRIAGLPATKIGYLRQGIAQGTGMPIIWIGAFLLAFLWLDLNLGDFQFLEHLKGVKLGWGTLSINFFRLLLVLIGFYMVRSGLIIVHTLIESIAEVNEQLDPGTTATLKTLLSYFVWGVFLIVSLAFIGVNLTSLIVVAGGLSVGIGFGMQSIVNNFISGLILLFGRSIKPGDIIQLGDLWAEVREVNIRTTEVTTFDQSSVFLPNSQLIGDQIVNWTHQNKTIRRKIIVGVAYGSDIDLVKRLLVYLAETNPRVYKVPAPFCRFVDFGSSSLDFCLYFYASIDSAWEIESEIRFDIDKTFKEYKVEIAFPQQDIHIKSGNGLDKLFELFNNQKAGAAKG